MLSKRMFLLGLACGLIPLVAIGGTLISGRLSMGAGAVGTNTQRVTLASDDPSVADLAAIEAALEATGWTVATKAINVPAGASTALVTTAGEGKKIRVLGLMGTADVSGTITLESASTAISGVIELAAKSGVVLPAIPAQNIALHGWCETADNEALNITTVTCTFDGMLIYATED